jgi:hypothetical protein
MQRQTFPAAQEHISDNMRASAHGAPLDHHHQSAPKPEAGIGALVKSFFEVHHNENNWVLQALKKGAKGFLIGALIGGGIANTFRHRPRLAWLKVLGYLDRKELSTGMY